MGDMSDYYGIEAYSWIDMDRKLLGRKRSTNKKGRVRHMGISGAKKKLRKGMGRPEGWYKVNGAKWELRTSQSSGDEFIVYAIEGEKRETGETEEIQLFLGMTSKIGDYVTVEDGALISVDDDEEYEIGENTGVGRFFASLSDHGVSDKIMDQIGDDPSVLEGLELHIVQEAVLDGNGEPKKNKDGYAITNTVVDKVESGKGGKKAKGKKAADDDEEEETPKAKGKAKGGKKAKPEPEDEDEDEEEEEEEEEEDTEEEDDEEEEEEEPKPRRRGATKGKGRAGR